MWTMSSWLKAGAMNWSTHVTRPHVPKCKYRRTGRKSTIKHDLEQRDLGYKTPPRKTCACDASLNKCASQALNSSFNKDPAIEKTACCSVMLWGGRNLDGKAFVIVLLLKSVERQYSSVLIQVGILWALLFQRDA